MRAIPRHIGIIMDGNGRWAELRGLPRFEGHRKGLERAKEHIQSARSIGVEVLSLYAFSIENWTRPKSEIGVIMELLETSLRDDFLNLLQEGVRFRVIGNRDKLPSHIRELIEHTEKATERNGNLVLQCALSYGGRDEIVRAVREVLRQGLRPEEITEDVMGSLLDTAGAPDPDLIIRTSGELRLSNFLLWQSAYSEFYFTNTLWPDFTKEELLDAIHEYQMRERRFGRIVSGVI